MFSEFVKSRELIIRLFLRDIQARYKQSVFGILWSFIIPLFTVGTFVYLNYSGVFNLGETDIPYPAYALLGITIWQLFASGLNACAGSLAGAGNLIGKINFAKESLIFSSFAQAIFDFVISFILVAGIFIIYHIIPSWTTIFLPLALIPLILLTLGLGFIFSVLNAVVRDTSRILSFAITFFLFLTPVLYPPPTIEPMATLNRLNPIGILVIGARDLVIKGSFTQPNEFLYASVFSIIIFLLSWRAFHMMEPRLAERV
jgi:lipopolysaccharide transport system permease protein